MTTLHLKEVARLYVRLTLYVCRLRYEDLKMKLNMNIRYLTYNSTLLFIVLAIGSPTSQKLPGMVSNIAFLIKVEWNNLNFNLSPSSRIM